MSWLDEIARWYGILLLLTWGWAPLVRLLCHRLPDRGATLTRPLALLGLVYPLWLLSSLDLLPYSTVGLWVTLATGATAGWAWALRYRLVSRSWLRSLLLAEALSLLAFVAYVWLRGYTPEILNTEKPMDSAFLASSARAVAMPPNDPWFAGEPINYYYLGYVLHGALTRLASLPASVGFNLALATTFSMTLTAAAGVGFNAARPWLSRRRAFVSGTLAAVLLALLGNLFAARQFLDDPWATIRAGWWENRERNGIGWASSRVVFDVLTPGEPAKETINEFPFFSFLLGDLHPHVMALPFTIVALGLALNLYLRGARPSGERRGDDLVAVAVAGAVVGSLYAMNSWDYPTYLLVAGAGLWHGFRTTGSRDRWLALSVLVGASVLAWLPFTLTFAPLTGGETTSLPELLRDVPIVSRLLTAVGAVTWDHTSMGEFLTVFGVPYVFGLWLLGSRIAPSVRSTPALGVSRSAVVIAAAAAVVAILLPAPLVILCGGPLAVALVLLRRNDTPGPRSLATGLFAGGLALVLVTEFFYVVDVFNSRFNTLFKVYYQAWTLFAVASALACVVLWREASPRRFARPAVLTVGAAAILAGAVYPVVASFRWTGEFTGWDGLDGVAYVGDTSVDELAAIRWLRDHAGADDVVLEAPGCSYDPNSQVPTSRVSAFTGVPTPIGWDGHEGQWRSGQPALRAQIAPRQNDARSLYDEPSGELRELYGITYVFVGRYEREGAGPACAIAGPYPSTKSPSFPGHGWEQAFASGDVRVFRRAGRPA